jgi:hypothetical protein
VRKQTQKHSSLKKAAQLVKQSESAFHATSELSAWNMHSGTMSDLEFGEASQSESVVASSVDQLNFTYSIS